MKIDIERLKMVESCHECFTPNTLADGTRIYEYALGKVAHCDRCLHRLANDVLLSLAEFFEKETKQIPINDENETKGSSTYNWNISFVKRLWRMVKVNASEENNEKAGPGA